jgi:sodium pump decarboxylase gamma subunit
MLLRGLETMIMGMAVVFLFLSLLVLVLMGTSFLFKRFSGLFQPEEEDEQEIAAAIAAIGAYMKK